MEQKPKRGRNDRHCVGMQENIISQEKKQGKCAGIRQPTVIHLCCELPCVMQRKWYYWKREAALQHVSCIMHEERFEWLDELTTV